MTMKMRGDPNVLVKSFKRLGFDKLVALEARGYSGGISLAWSFDKVEVEVLENSFQFLHVNLKFIIGVECLFNPVYANPTEEGRKELWKKLKRIS